MDRTGNDRTGNLYVVTGSGGVGGTVFELSPLVAGRRKSTPTFASGLTMDTSGNLSGVTLLTILELSPNGTGGWNPATSAVISQSSMLAVS